MDCPYSGNCKKCSVELCDEVNNGFCQRRFRLDKLFDEALVSKVQRVPIALYYNNEDSETFYNLEGACRNIEEVVKKGYNLYLYSNNTGNGKTSWALRLLSSYFYSIWYKSEISCKALFISVPKFLISLKENISKKSDYIEHIKENVMDCDLVIWDDIGSKCGTEFEIENMLSIINSRIDNGKTNIYTSNVNPDQLKDCVGSRLASRVVGMSLLFPFQEEDKRGLKS